MTESPQAAAPAAFYIAGTAPTPATLIPLEAGPAGAAMEQPAAAMNEAEMAAVEEMPAVPPPNPRAHLCCPSSARSQPGNGAPTLVGAPLTINPLPKTYRNIFQR